MSNLYARLGALTSVFTVLTALPSCRSAQDDVSGLTFAHSPANSAIGGPLGRLELIKNGLNVNFQNVRICVETGKAHISDAEIVLETKMAYAAWLAAAGNYSESDWKLFEFVGQPKCKQDDKSFASFIILADLNNILPGEGIVEQFDEQKLHCVASSGTKRCQSDGTTLGWGGPGTLNTWYQGNPNKWVKVEAGLPASVLLSPFLDWHSISEDVKRQPAAAMAVATRDDLRSRYAQLLAEAQPSMSQLAGYVDALGQANAKGSADPVFKQRAQQFYSASVPQLEVSYRGQRVAFNTLVHEVGHQFGMDHAHHPDQDSINGQSVDAAKNPEGQWVTDSAAMAYGDPFMYLTEDDALGSQSNGQALRTYAQSRK